MRTAFAATIFVFAFLLPVAFSQSAAGSAWQALERDNICGVANTRQVTNPALLNYRKVLIATPEMRDLRVRGIEPGSAEGQILKQRAVDHVRKASSKVMRLNGHCSLWKEISHRDGRRIPDLTGQVIAELSISVASMEKGPGVAEAVVVLAGKSMPESGVGEGSDGSASFLWAMLAICGGIFALLYVLRSRSPEDVSGS